MKVKLISVAAIFVIFAAALFGLSEIHREDSDAAVAGLAPISQPIVVTKQHRRILLTSQIFVLDNRLITEEHEGNRRAIATQLAVMRDTLRTLERGE